MIKSKMELQEYVDDVMTNVRAVKGENFEKGLRLLYEAINVGHMVGVALDRDMDREAKQFMFHRHMNLTAGFMHHVVNSLELSQSDYEEMLIMAQGFSKKSVELISQLGAED